MQHEHPRILIVGAGSAGHACASELRRQAPQIGVTVVDAEPGGAINRMLVTKGVLPGLLGPELIAQPPLPDAERIEGRAVELLRSSGEGPDARAEVGVRLADGRELTADAIVIASGSTARALGPEIEVDEQLAIRTVQTAADAAALRDAVAALPALPDGPRVAVIGAGFIATEVASHLNGIGCETVVLGRTVAPLAAAFGRTIAERLGELHREHRGLLDVEVRAVRARDDEDGVRIDLGDGTAVASDLVVAAIGVEPASEWAGARGGIAVDDRLRVREGVEHGSSGVVRGLYAAGGVAVHELSGEKIAIDHWDAAAEQGVHAARAILADLALADDPGPYTPRSGFTLQAYGQTFAGYGYRPRASVDRELQGIEAEAAIAAELIDRDGNVAGLAGLNAGATIRASLGRLGHPA